MRVALSRVQGYAVRSLRRILAGDEQTTRNFTRQHSKGVIAYVAVGELRKFSDIWPWQEDVIAFTTSKIIGTQTAKY